jgi:site-specific recombinase XerD
MHSNASLNEELLKYFIEYLETRTDKSAGTIANINRDIKAFIEYLKLNDDANIQAKSITHSMAAFEMVEKLSKV